MKYKVLFQMDSFDKINIKTDSTISIIKEALNFGIKVYVNNPDDLTLEKNSVFTNCTDVSLKNSKLSFGKIKRSNINKFDYFFIRQDPPFDLNYLTNCYLLELHQKFNEKPRFINDPAGIKNFTEKISPIYFSDLLLKQEIVVVEVQVAQVLQEVKPVATNLLQMKITKDLNYKDYYHEYYSFSNLLQSILATFTPVNS